MKAKLLVNGFLLYVVFAIIGSNLYIGSSAFSFGNVFFVIFIFIMVLLKGFERLNKIQVILFLPLLIFTIYITLYLVFSLDEMDLDILSKYYYLVTIPLLYLIIMSLSNKYPDYFISKVFFLIKFLILLITVVVIIEIVFDIHMPVYNSEINIFNIPTAFFGNSNDVGVISVILYLFFIPFNNFRKKRGEFYIITLLVFFLVIITISRTAFVILILLYPFYFIIIRKKSIRFVSITVLIAVILGYIFSSIVVTYIPKKELNVTGYINNRLLSLKDEKAYDVEGTSSVAVRYAIYSYPFKNPEKFITGYGFKGDQEILKREVRWSGMTNAHSFFIEVVYDFGWIALLLIVWFFVALLSHAIRKGKNVIYRYGILFIGSFMVLINISSSIFGRPIIWAPLFIYLAYITVTTKTEIAEAEVLIEEKNENNK